MGWSNYIIIKELKLIIEISRHDDELENYIEKSIDFLINDNCSYSDNIETDEIKVSNLTLKDLSILVTQYNNTIILKDLNYDKMFLYWLKHRKLDYEIKSEFDINLDEYKKEGYQIVMRKY